MKEKITLPIAILLSAIILAGGYYAVQYNKQQSIERRQEIKIVEEERIRETRQLDLNLCLSELDKTNPCGKFKFFGDIAIKYGLCKPEEKLKELRDECFLKYPIK